MVSCMPRLYHSMRKKSLVKCVFNFTQVLVPNSVHVIVHVMCCDAHTIAITVHACIIIDVCTAEPPPPNKQPKTSYNSGAYQTFN